MVDDFDNGPEKVNVIHDEEMNHVHSLSPEELQIERKLRWRIDGIIMPLVILVYLMNYIDRYVYSSKSRQALTGQEQLCCGKASGSPGGSWPG